MTQMPVFLTYKLKPVSGAADNSFSQLKLKLEHENHKNYQFFLLMKGN